MGVADSNYAADSFAPRDVVHAKVKIRTTRATIQTIRHLLAQ
jgi:hypothetical protein